MMNVQRTLSVMTTILSLVVSFVCVVRANTEIRNFDAPRDDLIPSGQRRVFETQIERRGGAVHTLKTGDKEMVLHAHSFGKDEWEEMGSRIDSNVWLKMELDDHAKFTLRLSWPAFYPTDFDIQLYTASKQILTLSQALRLPKETPDNATFPSQSPDNPDTRVVYARIKAINTGIIDPRLIEHSGNPKGQDIKLVVIIEPLLLNFLPRSLIPTLIALMVLITCAIIALNPITRFLAIVAEAAKKEMYLSKKD